MTLPPAFAPLMALRQFVPYRLVPDPNKPGKMSKRPTHHATGVTCNAHDPANQTDYATAAAAVEAVRGDGVGFVFTDGDNYFFLDMDRCRVRLPDGSTSWSPIALELLAALEGAGVEISQSDEGLHVIGRGTVPAHSCKNAALDIELYHTGRFVALTGKDARGSVDFDCTAALASIVSKYFPPNARGVIGEWTSEPCEGWDGPTDDDELIRIAIAADRRKPGMVFGNEVSFEDLWTANVDKFAARCKATKRPYGASEADYALASRLASRTGKNCERIFDIMMRSGLRRPKWDRPDYLRRTILRACATPVSEGPPQVCASAASALVTLPTPTGSTISEHGALRVINPADWASIDPPRRLWALDQWIPFQQATLLTGGGGVGKSLLAQQLATCVALGLPFLGKETRQANALYVTCEDDAGELHRRQDAICKALGVPMSELSGRLYLCALAGVVDNHLATFDATGALVVGNRYREIEQFCLDNRVGFVGLDNASHLMIGNHNELSAVAAFLGLLNGLAIKIAGTVTLLHHPNKAGDDWLGSVAWENQVRSRLFLKLSDAGGDSDARSLQNPKANYSASGGRLDFRWHKGAFVRDDDLPKDVHAALMLEIAAAHDDEVFLKCLRERTRQHRAVSEKRSATFAPTVFMTMPEAQGASKKRLDAAMDRLFRRGTIERAKLWKSDDRKDVYGLRESLQPESENGAGDGAGDAAYGC